MVGSATVSASDSGELGGVAWTTVSPYTMSYTPTTPGRQVLTAIVDDSTNSAMVGQSYSSTDSNSLNDYIWVMANEVAVTGPSVLRSGASGTFTATFNGPFVGTVNIADLIDVDSAGGTFNNGGVCTVDLDDYNATTNTTSCSFVYSPDIFDDSTSVTLAPSVSEDYPYIVTPTSWSVLVYGKPIITNITPERGPTTGGTVVTISGENLAQMGGLSVGNIKIDLSAITIIDNHTVSFVAPPNSAGVADVAVLVSSRTFHHPDLYTYIPIITDVDPNLGPTTGGTGFGTTYNPDGTVTITGDGILPTTRYSDGTNQYSKVDYLEFDGSQYINTGVNQLGNTKMTLDMTRDSGMYAAGVLVPGDYFMITLNDNGLTPPTANYGNASRTSGGIMPSGSRVNAVLDANGSTASFAVSLNGGSTNTNTISPSSPPSNAHNVYLGRINNGSGTTDGIVGKIYSFAIDKTGTANDRNFVPVCSADGVGGMFDTVNNVFYPSASSFPFVCDFEAIALPTVTFGSVIVPESDITIVDLSTITVKPPAQNEGAVNVKIDVNGVTALLENGYTYRAPMEIFTVSPPTGEEDGGTEVTITGNNFISPFGPPSAELPLVVTFDIGGTPAICVNPVITNTTITCTSSAHAEGLVSVTVDNTTESFTMNAVADPNGDGKMPTTDSEGRSTGGFFYGVAVFISIATPDTSVDLDVSLSQPYDEGSTTISVTTNNPNGYTLTVRSDPTDLVCESDSSLKIPTTSGNGLDGGTWGYQAGTTISANAWLGMSSAPAVIASSSTPTFTTPNPPSAADTQVNFGIRNGTSVPINVSCTKYSQTIIYMAVANN